MTSPALLGGTPAFPDGLPFFRPAKPPLERVTARLAPSYERGVLTNGPLVRQFEAEAAERLGVPRLAAVAVAKVGREGVSALAKDLSSHRIDPIVAAVMASWRFGDGRDKPIEEFDIAAWVA
jgi:hypothetical protein